MHGAIERWFEREALARPIAGRAEANHLLLDDAAAFRFPLPDAALEFLAAQILAADFFLGELAFDDELRGDSGVVHSGEPESAMAAHAVPADQHVDLRVLEHVADVDRAGDIGRRQGDRKCVDHRRNFRRGRAFRRTRTWPSALRFPAARKPWEFPGAWIPCDLEFPSEVKNHYKGRVRKASNAAKQAAGHQLPVGACVKGKIGRLVFDLSG